MAAGCCGESTQARPLGRPKRGAPARGAHTGLSAVPVMRAVLPAAAMAALCAGLSTGYGWPSEMDEVVAAAVAAQRCDPDEVRRKDLYEKGDQVIVERHEVGMHLHGEIFSVGFGGRRNSIPENEVYRIQYDGIDTGQKAESKVPARRIQLAPQRCDSVFSGNRKYRFIIGPNVEMVRLLPACVLVVLLLSRALLTPRWHPARQLHIQRHSTKDRCRVFAGLSLQVWAEAPPDEQYHMWYSMHCTMSSRLHSCGWQT